jgi:hypothetical protein
LLTDYDSSDEPGLGEVLAGEAKRRFPNVKPDNGRERVAASEPTARACAGSSALRSPTAAAVTASTPDANAGGRVTSPACWASASPTAARVSAAATRRLTAARAVSSVGLVHASWAAVWAVSSLPR